MLAVAPLAMPPFISSYAWVSLSNGLQDFGGALLVVTCAYYPLVYLPVAAALRGLDPALEETRAIARRRAPGDASSASSLPQLRPALLRRRAAGRARRADRVRRLRAAALPHLHHRALRPIPHRARRAGSLAARARADRSLPRLRPRENSGARPGALCARRRRRATRCGAPSRLGWIRWPALLAFAALTIATLGVPIGMIGYWLLAARAGRDLAGRAVLRRAARPRDARFRRLRPRRRRRRARACGAARLSRGRAYPSRLRLRSGARRLSRAGRAGHRRRAGAHLADGADGRARSIRARRCWSSPMRSCFCRSRWSACGRRWRRSSRASRRSGARSGSAGSSVAWRVVAPLAATGPRRRRGAGVHLRLTELTATLLLAPIGTRTLATEVWADTSSLAFAAAAPFAALMLCAVARCHLALRAPLRRRAAFAGSGLTMADVRISVKRLSKAFGGTPVLRGVDLAVAPRARWSRSWAPRAAARRRC